MTRIITRSKVKEWIWRYLPAEIIATFTALLSAGITFSVTNSYALSAIVGTIGENVGYYSYFIFKEASNHHKVHKTLKFPKRAILIFRKTTRNLLLEFGPAELVDSLIVRPFAMFVAPQLISPYLVGILAGKLTADAVFYGIAIVGYEARKKWFKN